MQAMHLRNTCNEWTIVKNFTVFLPTSTMYYIICMCNDNHSDRTSSEAEKEWWSWDVRRLGWWDEFLVPVSPCVSIINGSVTPFYIHTPSSHRPYNIGLKALKFLHCKWTVNFNENSLQINKLVENRKNSHLLQDISPWIILCGCMR